MVITQDRKRARQWNRRIHKGRNLKFCRHRTECKDQLIAKSQVRRRTVKEGLFYKFCLHEGLCSGQSDNYKEATIDLRPNRNTEDHK